MSGGPRPDGVEIRVITRFRGVDKIAYVAHATSEPVSQRMLGQVGQLAEQTYRATARAHQEHWKKEDGVVVQEEPKCLKSA